MKIAAIIPTFNRRQELSDLLWMLGNMDMPEGCELDIITVVDGSTDGTIEMLTRDFPHVHSVKGTGNWWYTKSINQGFRYAERLHPDLILTLNDDIIVHDDYLQKLVEAYRKKDPDSIMGSISFTHDQPHRVTNSGVKDRNKLLDKAESYIPFLAHANPSTLTGTLETPVLPGRGMLIPWKIATQLNYFDENFAQYQSDFDFTLRAIKAGFSVYISWDAQVFSMLNKTNSGSSFLKSSWKTYFKNLFNPYSRSYLPNRSRYYWRHNYKLLWPVYMIKYLTLSAKNHISKNKFDATWPKNSSSFKNYFRATGNRSLTDSV
jgi:GT2 family glycosyltransferase